MYFLYYSNHFNLWTHLRNWKMEYVPTNPGTSCVQASESTPALCILSLLDQLWCEGNHNPKIGIKEINEETEEEFTHKNPR